MPSKKLRILVVFEVPRKPELPLKDYLKLPDWEDERDVVRTLKSLGHEVLMVGIGPEINPLITMIQQEKPDLIFNLCETLNKNRKQEPNIAGICELFNIPYTGASPFALHLCQDKAMQKKILSYGKIKTPQFQVVSKNEKKPNLNHLSYPVIIKPLNLEASEGISQKSYAQTPGACLQRISFIQKKFNSDIIVEEYIDGTDIYAAVMGNNKIIVGHPIELVFSHYPEKRKKIATYKTKWDDAYRKKWGIRTHPLKNKELAQSVKKICKKIYSELKISGYARFDLRASPQRGLFFIEANPNPSIAKEDDFSKSVKAIGFSYKEILQKIIYSSLH